LIVFVPSNISVTELRAMPMAEGALITASESTIKPSQSLIDTEFTDEDPEIETVEPGTPVCPSHNTLPEEITTEPDPMLHCITNNGLSEQKDGSYGLNESESEWSQFSKLSVLNFPTEIIEFVVYDIEPPLENHPQTFGIHA
jgi:hypothetical protein